MTVAADGKVTCKAHVKDICFTRMYITNHFDAPFENFRLDQAVHDLVEETGLRKEQLLPITCFIYKGYLWTINNRRLWVLRHALMFGNGKGDEVDVLVLPDSAMPERKDYISRLQFHKQEALAHPKFWPIMHGDKPQLQKYLMRPIVFRFETALRNGYRILPGGRLLCINGQEAAIAFQASAPRYNHMQPGAQAAKPKPEDEEDKMSVFSETPSMASVDFPGKVTDVKGPYATSWSMEKLKNLPTLKEGKEGEETAEGEEEEAKEAGAIVVAGQGMSEQKKKELGEVAKHFKAAVSQLRLVLDNLDQAFDKLAA